MKYLAVLCLAAASLLAQPKTELLWPQGAPKAVGQEDADKPSLTFYPAANPNGAGVLVCPGGGYGALAMDHEGKQIAEWFNSFGVSAFILKYRLGPRYQHPAMLDDARQAIRTIRSRAAEFKLADGKLGVMGFSAGGHLASSLSTHYQPGERPDFSILVYPVITMTTPFTHKGSLRNLLGQYPEIPMVLEMSNERKVNSQTPPAFLFHTDNDQAVPVENAVMYYSALRAAGVPAELHIYANGRHGVGLAQNDPVLKSWPDRLKDWMVVRGYIPR